MQPYKRSIRALLGTLLVFVLLIAPHEGEFWPFSIYPMFSQAGHPWSRAVVRDLGDQTSVADWDAVPAAELPGEPLALIPHGVRPIDLANFISQTDVWDTDRVQGLRNLLYGQNEDRHLLVMRVRGTIDEGGSTDVRFEPYVLLAPSETRLNPRLQPALPSSSR